MVKFCLGGYTAQGHIRLFAIESPKSVRRKVFNFTDRLKQLVR